MDRDWEGDMHRIQREIELIQSENEKLEEEVTKMQRNNLSLEREVEVLEIRNRKLRQSILDSEMELLEFQQQNRDREGATRGERAGERLASPDYDSFVSDEATWRDLGKGGRRKTSAPASPCSEAGGASASSSFSTSVVSTESAPGKGKGKKTAPPPAAPGGGQNSLAVSRPSRPAEQLPDVPAEKRGVQSAARDPSGWSWGLHSGTTADVTSASWGDRSVSSSSLASYEKLSQWGGESRVFATGDETDVIDV